MKKNHLEINDKIKLYYPSPDFALPLFQLIESQKEYLKEWMPWANESNSLPEIKTVLKENIRSNLSGQKLTTYIFSETELIGSLALLHIDKEHFKAEIGYWLHKEYQGKGTMTQCLQRLINYVYRTSDINRLYMQIPTANSASISLAERLDFRHEGTLRADAFINGKMIDMKIYGLLRSEWSSSLRSQK